MEIPLVCSCCYNCFILCVWFKLLAHPNYLCFGDDRVRGTRKQMLLQVDLVRHRTRVWVIMGTFLQRVYFMNFKVSLVIN